MRRRQYRRSGFHCVRAFGWQLDYRADGWLPLGVREGWWGGWHVLQLGRFGCVTFGRLAKPLRPVTVTITADTSRFSAALRAAARAGRESNAELQSHLLFRARIRLERAAGLAYVDELLDDMCADLGIDRRDVGGTR